MPTKAKQSALIDFCEIETGDQFEDFVAELVREIPGVLAVKKTGRGPDLQADLIVTIQQRNVLSLDMVVATAVVQCKHLAKSGASVRPKDCRPLDVLMLHKADIYLLATSTCPSSTVAKTLNELGSETRTYGKVGIFWDRTELERLLLRRENEQVLARFFPESYERFKRSFPLIVRRNLRRVGDALAKRTDVPSVEDLLALEDEDRSMREIYLIRSLDEAETAREVAIRQHVQPLGINLETSSDALSKSVWSIAGLCEHSLFLESVDAVFAFVTAAGARSPNVWLEIQQAQTHGKLKAVFVDKSVYRVTLLGHYPCIVFDENESQSLERFVAFYRNARQTWGDKSSAYFWFGVSALLCHFRPELRQ